MSPRRNKTNYLSEEQCSIARALEVVGDRWNVLILREAFRGLSRFEDIRKRLGIAPNMLSTRIAALVDQGVLEARLYQEQPKRWSYELTDKGRDFYPVIVSLMNWGDAWAAENGPPIVLMHGRHRARARLVCGHCNDELTSRDTSLRPGPGALSRTA